MLKLYRIICSSTARPVSSETKKHILSFKICQIRNGSRWELIGHLIFTVRCPHLQNTNRTRPATHKSGESLKAVIEPVCGRQTQLWGLFQHRASQSPLVFWLSEEEVEDVEDMQDLASRPSRTDIWLRSSVKTNTKWREAFRYVFWMYLF